MNEIRIFNKWLRKLRQLGTNKLFGHFLLLEFYSMKNISDFATWPGDCFNNNENYLSARDTCQNSCIFSPIMSESLYLDSLEILQNTILFASVAIQS